MVKVQDIIDRIEKYAPLELKEDGDPTGFQIGDRNQSVNKVMTTLDIRPNTVKEAIEKKVDFIFSHHPIMFRPARTLDIASPQNKMYFDLIQNNISVYSAHTNMDKTENGMNDWLSEQLNLKNIRPISELNGLGRVGELPASQTLNEFSKVVKKSFNLKNLRIIRPYNEKLVHHVAIIGGDGGKFYPNLLNLNMDTFITGDVYYHTAHDMQAAGLNVLDPGHNIENIFISKTSGLLELWNQEYNWNIDVIESTVSTQPFDFI